MGIKVVIVAALLCSLVSICCATAGKAGHADTFMPSKKCPDIKNPGKFTVAVNSQIISNRGYYCGDGMRVMCGVNGNKPYCKHAKFVDVKLVAECTPEQCPGENDIILSKEAFSDIANISEQKIDVGWTHAILKMH
ncbi:hypothetical protein POM88_047840 [Heracleum sosnowskyi]|uniref:Expansin-like EG45 domain-containing protein n=1 Tax=Heracleum sosnowskyi TaxID=360622 RepID=A0AAD8GUM8_9APIA|nr:hypothetical protein POM88_047835 [Heracleum sosnowskyi]KAK1354582.1 hypothetical protein POM88_047838 [Heracleum sosnowskyi]KAK1354584.1 hypothetical protein POM88_047840 [Heracleum sosnowskyi]